MFAKATPDDLPRISEIYAEIHTEEEAGRTTTGWIRGVYPTEDSARAAILAGDLFVEKADGQLIAAGRINHQQVAEYVHSPWRFDAPANEVMVLHMLTVSPRLKGCGYGSAFVSFYERYALEHGCRYLRMDTNERNLAARALYQKLGYAEIGVVDSVFNGIPGVRLVCLEKFLPDEIAAFQS
ncbi:MAG: GNAT family N-acetyltransferase [Oscillibacter sp.]|jgi:GNAT superfamily N-acetyltransferase|nr:GNAT family N-acetyltransferase [Oscillibacter sp.]